MVKINNRWRQKSKVNSRLEILLVLWDMNLSYVLCVLKNKKYRLMIKSLPFWMILGLVFLKLLSPKNDWIANSQIVVDFVSIMPLFRP